MNKFACLDRGYVAVISSNISANTFKSVVDSCFNGKVSKELLEHCHYTFVFKCPLFVQLHLSSYNLKMTNTSYKTRETYVPSTHDIGSKDLQTSQEMREYFEQSVEAINTGSAGLRYEGCDEAVSLVLTPISTYVEIVVTGDLGAWVRYIKNDKVPKIIDVYRQTVAECIKADWPNFNNVLNTLG